MESNIPVLEFLIFTNRKININCNRCFLCRTANVGRLIAMHVDMEETELDINLPLNFAQLILTIKSKTNISENMKYEITTTVHDSFRYMNCRENMPDLMQTNDKT